MKRLSYLVCVLMLMLGFNAFASGIFSQYGYNRGGDFYDTFIKGRISAGLRFSYFSFTEPSKKSYDSNGNLDGGYTHGISTYDLDERQFYVPTPYLIYAFTPYFGMQVAWEHVEGRAWTLDMADPHYDGDLTLAGPSFILQGRYPNNSRFTPFGGIGIAFLFADFEEESSWSAGGFRNMEADDTLGLIFEGGCSAEVYDRVNIDLSLAYMSADSDARYYLRGEDRDRATWEFPASSIMIRIGARYSF